MKFSLTLLLILVSLANSNGQTVVPISDGDLQGGQTYNWTSDNIYMLDGFVFLEAGGVLNIAPGTVIKGKQTPGTGDNASALIITRGAKIYADGNADNPIIFTGEFDDTNDNSDLDETDNGLWGGLILLGYGKIGFSADSANIEGIPTSEVRGFYGGNNDDDNSGSLQYVSIRHGGAALAPGDEINGLTLGGVGSQTVFDHIEIFANFDDGVEWFGGKPNVKHLISAFCADDAVDWDQGFRGQGQFWFVIQREDIADNSAEQDGANPDGATPFSNPVIYNATYIGSGTAATASNPTALLFRDATGGTYGNSIFTEVAGHAIEVEDLPSGSGVDSRQRMQDGDLQLLNNLWWDFGSGNELNTGANGIIRATDGAEDPDALFLVNHFNANNNSISDPLIAGIGREIGGNLWPLPAETGPVWSDLATEPTDAFFEDVNYKGAFGATNWALGWTALDAYGYFNNTTGISENLDKNLPVLSQNMPSPADAFTRIEFELPQTGNVNMTIYDLSGRIISMPLHSTGLSAGSHSVLVDVSLMQNGVYIYELLWNGMKMSRQMMVVH